MDVGLLSDVHGNLPALDAVLEDMPPVETLIHAGDVVGYGPYPEETLDRFEEYDIVSIQGNHDRAVSDEASLDRFRERFSTVATSALRWTREQLTERERSRLGDLPTERRLFGGALRIVHGSPADPDEYVYPADVSAELLSGEDVLVMGHTHVQNLETYSSGSIVNPGSVGQPRDDDPRAAYAILDTESNEITLRRTEYPVERIRSRILETKLPDVLADRLEND